MTSGNVSRGATISGVIGIALNLVVGCFYLSSGLMVPGPWLFILWGIWLAGIYPLVSVFRRRRVWTPVVAVAAIVVGALSNHRRSPLRLDP